MKSLDDDALFNGQAEKSNSQNAYARALEIERRRFAREAKLQGVQEDTARAQQDAARWTKISAIATGLSAIATAVSAAAAAYALWQGVKL